MNEGKNSISLKIRNQLLETLKTRFEKNMVRHEGIEWEEVKNKIIKNNKKLKSLFEMERTGGEPDVVSLDKTVENFIFFDCSEESPKGRRSLCYDFEAQDSRKKNKPENNIIDMAEAMGIELLTEEQYRFLQKFGNFDTKTSSWIKTPDNIRKLGGAIFGDRRYDTVFIYHNGAESYYSGRGFRGLLTV
ncbi:MAG: DUF4256 domain-containing protein [Sphaerochaetaceae bacterium]